MAKKLQGPHMNTKDSEQTVLTDPALILALGPFNTDPCCPEWMPWVTATTMYSKKDDGMVQPWKGRTWCNPPYNNWPAGAKLCRKHADSGGSALLLIFARTDTEDFHRTIFGMADGILWMKGRMQFFTKEGVKMKGNGGAPSIIAIYGMDEVERINKLVEAKKIRGCMQFLNNKKGST